MADALISDQEIAILCDVLEGGGANLNADKRKVLDQLIVKGFVVAADQSRLQNTNLPPRLNNLGEPGFGLSGG